MYKSLVPKIIELNNHRNANLKKSPLRRRKVNIEYINWKTNPLSEKIKKKENTESGLCRSIFPEIDSIAKGESGVHGFDKTSLVNLLLDSWIKSIERDQRKFSSPFISAEIKLTEARDLTRNLGKPNTLTASCACILLKWITPYFGDYCDLMKVLVDEIFVSIFLGYDPSEEANAKKLMQGTSYFDRNKKLAVEVNILDSRMEVFKLQKDAMKKELERRKLVFNSTVKHWQTSILNTAFQAWGSYCEMQRNILKRLKPLFNKFGGGARKRKEYFFMKWILGQEVCKQERTYIELNDIQLNKLKLQTQLQTINSTVEQMRTDGIALNDIVKQSLEQIMLTQKMLFVSSFNTVILDLEYAKSMKLSWGTLATKLNKHTLPNLQREYNYFLSISNFKSIDHGINFEFMRVIDMQLIWVNFLLKVAIPRKLTSMDEVFKDGKNWLKVLMAMINENSYILGDKLTKAHCVEDDFVTDEIRVKKVLSLSKEYLDKCHSPFDHAMPSLDIEKLLNGILNSQSGTNMLLAYLFMDKSIVLQPIYFTNNIIIESFSKLVEKWTSFSNIKEDFKFELFGKRPAEVVIVPAENNVEEKLNKVRKKIEKDNIGETLGLGPYVNSRRKSQDALTSTVLKQSGSRRRSMVEVSSKNLLKEKEIEREQEKEKEMEKEKEKNKVAENAEELHLLFPSSYVEIFTNELVNLWENTSKTRASLEPIEKELNTALNNAPFDIWKALTHDVHKQNSTSYGNSKEDFFLALESKQPITEIMAITNIRMPYAEIEQEFYSIESIINIYSYKILTIYNKYSFGKSLLLENFYKLIKDLNILNSEFNQSHLNKVVENTLKVNNNPQTAIQWDTRISPTNFVDLITRMAINIFGKSNSFTTCVKIVIINYFNMIVSPPPEKSAFQKSKLLLKGKNMIALRHKYDGLLRTLFVFTSEMNPTVAKNDIHKSAHCPSIDNLAWNKFCGHFGLISERFTFKEAADIFTNVHLSFISKSDDAKIISTNKVESKSDPFMYMDDFWEALVAVSCFHTPNPFVKIEEKGEILFHFLQHKSLTIII